MNFRLLPLAAAAACSCTLPLTAQAQASAPQRIEITAPALQKLDQSATSGSRLGLSLRETPAAVTRIDTAEIEAIGALDTQDILKLVPGVSFSAQPGSPGSVFFRGFGAASLAQLYNGVSVQYDAIAARPVDAWLIDRVETIGGPSSFLNGSGAVGGSINVITKIADTQGDLNHARLALGEQRQAAFSLQRSLGAHVLRADLNTTRGTVDTLGRDREAWQVGLSWRAGFQAFGAAASHTLAVEQQHELVEQPYWGTPLLRDANNAVLGEVRIDPRTRGVNYNVVDGKYEQGVLWARSILELAFSPATRATHTLYHYEALRDYENVETYTFVNANTQVERSAALLQRHNQDVTGSRGELTHRTTLAGRKSDFALGWDYSYNRQTRYPLSVAGPFDRTDPYNPTPTTFYATPGVVPGYTPGATNLLRNLALFAENRTVLAPGWALTSGLRADRIELTVLNRRTPTATNPAVYETAFSPVTGRLGLVHDLTPGWQVYAQLSTAADPPSGLLATAGFTALRDFDLTKGRQVELGSKASFDQQRGEVSVAVYQIERKNLSITDPNDRTRVLPVGQQSSRGVELSARWRPTATLSGGLQLAYTDAQFDDFTETVGTTVVSRAGNTPANTPAWVAGVQLGWQLLPALQLSADGRFVGKRYANTANTVWEGGYTLLGLALQWQAAPGLNLRVRVNNATDETYSATLGTNLVYLGAPRSVSASVDWKF
jgi:iron complex outermembrane receptor protein